LPLLLSSYPGSRGTPQVLGRDLGCCLVACSIGGFELLLPSVASGVFRYAAGLVSGLGQQLVTLSSLLLDNRSPNRATSG
jgi:hypothetical protein